MEKKYPKMLSGGQQQRVALARILVKKPQILLLDEPFSALDAYLKEELQLELKALLKEFKGNAILVTHDRDEAYKLCDTLAIMEEGRMIAYGSTKDMFERPGDYQTAKLTGCKNLSVARREDAHSVYAVDWGIRLEVSGEIPQNLKYVGIRAHDFIPVMKKEGQTNCLAVKNAEIIDSPFEENLIFSAPSGKSIWWKIGQKNTRERLSAAEVPSFLRVEPERVMLLE